MARNFNRTYTTITRHRNGSWWVGTKRYVDPAILQQAKKTVMQMHGIEQLHDLAWRDACRYAREVDVEIKQLLKPQIKRWQYRLTITPQETTNTDDLETMLRQYTKCEPERTESQDTQGNYVVLVQDRETVEILKEVLRKGYACKVAVSYV